MELTRRPDVDVPPLRLVPAGFDPADIEAIDGLVQDLLARPIGSPAELEAWVRDWGELGAVVEAEWMRRGTAMHRDTTDPELEKRHRTFEREVGPAWKTREDKLNRRYLESPFRRELGDGFAVFDRSRRKDADIFREANTKLAAEDYGLAADYQKVCGAMTVRLDGEELTPQQCSAVLQERDRGRRETAWRALAQRRLEDAGAIDAILDRLVSLRDTMGRNAGFDGYLGLRFAQLDRFDYTEADCERFQAAAEKHARPAARELLAARCERLGLDAARPWDVLVSPFDREPTRLFADQDGLVALARRLFEAVDPAFAGEFDVLVRNGLLDLMSRQGKAPGGYNCGLEDIRLPFIFMNAVGLPNDVATLMHEGGHAFHSLLARDQDLYAYRDYPAEFAEVASMSMELFALERYDRVFGPDHARELAYTHLEGIPGRLCRIAQIDAFQHWMYRHPSHTHEERHAKWAELDERFGTGVDWTGLEAYRAAAWQRWPHFFTHPLYYIEYGIAQLGALQMWRNERTAHEAAIAAYRRALAAGGSLALPDLFAAAGIRFAMDDTILGELVPELMDRIRSLRWN